MHLKNQKRKIKMKKDDKTKLLEEKVPVIDFYVLKSKTIKILLTSTAVTSLGLNTPVFYLVRYLNETLNSHLRIELRLTMKGI